MGIFRCAIPIAGVRREINHIPKNTLNLFCAAFLFSQLVQRGFHFDACFSF